MKTDTDEIKKKKLEILRKTIMRMTDPDSFPPVRLSLEECAILMSRGQAVLTRSEMTALERSALTKMRNAFEKLGIDGMSSF